MDMMKDKQQPPLTPIDYCEHWCGELTVEQLEVLKRRIISGNFSGVGRLPGYPFWFPTVKVGSSLNIIDRAGYLQLASLTGATNYPHSPGSAMQKASTSD